MAPHFSNPQACSADDRCHWGPDELATCSSMVGDGMGVETQGDYRADIYGDYGDDTYGDYGDDIYGDYGDDDYYGEGYLHEYYDYAGEHAEDAYWAGVYDTVDCVEDGDCDAL